MIIDCHQHFGGVGQLFLAGETSGPDPRSQDYLSWDAERRRAAMARLGIEACVIMPAFEYSTHDGSDGVRSVNSRIADYVRIYEFVVAGLGILDPFAMNSREMSDEAIRIKELGLSGVAWHTRFQRTTSDSPRILDTLEAIGDVLGLHAFHCVAESELEAPWRLFHIASKFPDLDLLALSSLGSLSQCEEMLFYCEQFGNVTVDTGAMLNVGGWIERLVKALGMERLMVGTDLYVDPEVLVHRSALIAVEEASLEKDALEHIHWRNASKLFSLSLEA